MANITWDDKTALNPQPSIPRENKCTDDDLNEIKQVVNGNYNTLIGSIYMYAGSTAPTGYLICDGQAVSRSTYSDLFSVIGTTYGSGDGSTTFNIPNLKGKVIVGVDSNDSDFDTLGETGGEKTHTLTIDEMPKHDHKANEDNANDQFAYHSSTISAYGSTVATGYGLYRGNNTAKTGGDQPHNIMQPYMVLNYIIRY
jgi:microcystin-dependent protein